MIETPIDSASMTLTVDEDGNHSFTICGTKGQRSYEMLLSMAQLFFALAKQAAGEQADEADEIGNARGG